MFSYGSVYHRQVTKVSYLSGIRRKIFGKLLFHLQVINLSIRVVCVCMCVCMCVCKEDELLPTVLDTSYLPNAALFFFFSNSMYLLLMQKNTSLWYQFLDRPVGKNHFSFQFSFLFCFLSFSFFFISFLFSLHEFLLFNICVSTLL